DIYPGEPEDFFGYKVLQFMFGEDKGVLVTAPLKQNGSGAICRYDESQKSRCFVPEGRTLPLKHFGLSIAEDSTRSQFTVCSPSLVHECYQNSFLHGACFNFDNQLQEIFNFTPAFEKCTKKTVDLAFLFDGSESMATEEFQENINFIESIMHGLKNSSIKFAAAQFSSKTRKVFDFKDYEEGRASDLLRNVKHMKDLTNTHGALHFVLDNILEDPAAGASHDATKVVVIITDGDPSDKDRRGIIAKYDSKNIIRFVIGVKNVTLDKLKTIASHPKDTNTLKISNYSGLTDILGNFEKKIFNIEGSKAALADNLVNEMSQSGFSRFITFSIHTYLNTLNLTFPTISEVYVTDFAYAGYSISTGEWNNISLYFTGAPRYNHTGEVIFFSQADKNWTTEERLNGEQIGSYFGAELCAVDVDSDGNTDFLLVGAPLFHHSQDKREGLISIYKLTHELKLKSAMNVSVPSRGRFGTTITSVADLNGDGLRDVAVGAPLEDNKKGAVYIYLGDKHTGIRSNYSQRIIGKKIDFGLQLFGQAIDGNVDLDGDGLTDIAIGSKGKKLILSSRSRPVFNVSAYMSFEPAEISTDKIDCPDTTDTSLLMVTLTVCFNLTETTSRPAGREPGLNISYVLNVDSMRQTKRGFFREHDKRASHLKVSQKLSDSVTCINHPVYMPKCVTDTLSPISIRLKFEEEQSATQAAFLNVDSVTQAVAEVPFEKYCTKNDTCIAELDVNFEFSTPTLLVVDQDYFNVTVVLLNRGDDSYNTSLTFHYPPGLSFSMMTFVTGTRSVLHSCNDLEGVLDKTACGISLPVYRHNSTATFKTLFRIMSSHDWNETMSMTIIGQSDNGNSTRGSLTKSIDVQFQIHLAVTVNEDSITYLNFTPEDSGPKILSTIYENLGFKSVPVYVTLYIPTKLEHNFELKNYQVSNSQKKTECKEVNDGESELCSSDKHGCKSIMCESFVLDKYSTSTFILTGEVTFKDLKQHAEKNGLVKQFTGDGAEVLFHSSLKVGYDKKRYVLASSKNKGDVKVEFIVSPNEPLIIGTGVSGGLLLLIIIIVIMFKMGCFKRKTVEYYQEQEEKANDDLEDSEGEADGQSQPENKPDQPAEAKPLLNDGFAATNSSPFHYSMMEKGLRSLC
uniref:VWFA domain-containing protein n=1 Tax=Myripristis murdjan TaxID=586833 RepID=A0A667Y0X9_9TELE